MTDKKCITEMTDELLNDYLQFSGRSEDRSTISLEEYLLCRKQAVSEWKKGLRPGTESDFKNTVPYHTPDPKPVITEVALHSSDQSIQEPQKDPMNRYPVAEPSDPPDTSKIISSATKKSSESSFLAIMQRMED